MRINALYLGSIVVTAYLVLQGHLAQAAEFSTYSVSSLSVLKIAGEIGQGDAEKARQQIKAHPPNRIELDSPGGLFKEALEIGQMVTATNAETYVGPNEMCASACAYIWMSSKRKTLTSTSKVGFHAIYLNNPSKPVSSDGNAMAGAYLARLGFSDFMIIYATQAQPESMRWLTPNDAKFLGLDVVWQTEDIEPFKIKRLPTPPPPLLTLAEIDDQIVGIPHYYQIKQKFPEDYARLIAFVFKNQSLSKSAGAVITNYYDKELSRKIDTYLNYDDTTRLGVLFYNDVLVASQADVKSCGIKWNKKGESDFPKASPDKYVEFNTIRTKALERGVRLPLNRKVAENWLKHWRSAMNKKFYISLSFSERIRMDKMFESRDSAMVCKYQLFMFKAISKDKRAAFYSYR